MSHVVELINELWDVDTDKITPTANFIKDIGADYLDTVDLIMHLEKEFGVEIPDKVSMNMRTPNDIVAFLVQNTGCGKN
jgi:acyl carrier protein